MAVRAVVDLHFPARDPHLLTASGEVRGRCARPDEMVPAMLAGLVGNAEFCNAHDGGMGDDGQDAFCKVLFFVGVHKTSLWKTWRR